MTVPLSTAAVIVTIAIAATAVAVAVIVTMRTMSRRAESSLAEAHRAQTDEILTEMRRITAVVSGIFTVKRKPPLLLPPADDDPETRIEQLKDEIDAGPYSRHHIRGDLPPGVDRITWDGPDGPVTVARRARGGTAARRLRGGYRSLIAVPFLGTALRMLTVSPAATASAMGVGVVAIAPGAIPAIVREGPPRPHGPRHGQLHAPVGPLRPTAAITPTPPSPTPTPSIEATDAELTPPPAATTTPEQTTPTPTTPPRVAADATSGTTTPTPTPTTATSPTATTTPSTDAAPATGREQRRPDGTNHPAHQ